jgi:methylmalonyl-CoA mutase C-terminal domain/subunit
MGDKKIRVLMAKPGLDGHDRGVKTVIHALHDAGIDVTYTGLHKTPEEIVKAASDDNVSLVGLSILSGAHIHICAQIVKLMKEAGISDKPLMVGGVIPERDIPALREMGVEGIFPVDTPFEDIVRFVEEKGR